MGKSKIVDAAEVTRWIEEGVPYREMAERYLERYHIEVSQAMFSNFRARHGLTRRRGRAMDLVPWSVAKEHVNAYPLSMLRLEARLRDNLSLSELERDRLFAFKTKLADSGRVVHYERRTEQGWWLMPRREGVDADLIRKPERPTAQRGEGF